MKPIKTRKKHKCWKCRKPIPKGSFCFGKGNYAKVCIKCQRDIVFPNKIKIGERYIAKAKEENKDLKLNWKKYERVNILANLQEE